MRKVSPWASRCCEKDLASTAREILAKAEAAKCKVLLPVDVVVVAGVQGGRASLVVDAAACPTDQMILDIGPRSVANYIAELRTCATLVWNGPVGAFELKPFDEGGGAGAGSGPFSPAPTSCCRSRAAAIRWRRWRLPGSRTSSPMSRRQAGLPWNGWKGKVRPALRRSSGQPKSVGHERPDDDRPTAPSVGSAGTFREESPKATTRERLTLALRVHPYQNPKIVAGRSAPGRTKSRRAARDRAAQRLLDRAGRLEPWETTEQAAQREAREEACAEIEIDRLLAMYSVARIRQMRIMYRAAGQRRRPPGRKARPLRWSTGPTSRGTSSPFRPSSGRSPISTNRAREPTSRLTPTRQATWPACGRRASPPACNAILLLAPLDGEEDPKARSRSRSIWRSWRVPLRCRPLLAIGTSRPNVRQTDDIEETMLTAANNDADARWAGHAHGQPDAGILDPRLSSSDSRPTASRCGSCCSASSSSPSATPTAASASWSIAVRNRCASLFFGRNEEGGLRCVYHGWKFDVEGNCVDMPERAAGPRTSSIASRTSPTRWSSAPASSGLHGPAPGSPPLPSIEVLMLPEEERITRLHMRECNWFQSLEGDIDTLALRLPA